MSHITASGNTEIPAYFALSKLGYDIERGLLDCGEELWMAKQEEEVFSGSSPVEVLGLSLMRQTRGEPWVATDDEIQSFMKAFYPEAPPVDRG